MLDINNREDLMERHFSDADATAVMTRCLTQDGRDGLVVSVGYVDTVHGKADTCGGCTLGDGQDCTLPTHYVDRFAVTWCTRAEAHAGRRQSTLEMGWADGSCSNAMGDDILVDGREYADTGVIERWLWRRTLESADDCSLAASVPGPPASLWHRRDDEAPRDDAAQAEPVALPTRVYPVVSDHRSFSPWPFSFAGADRPDDEPVGGNGRECPACCGSGTTRVQTEWAWYGSGSQLGKDSYEDRPCDTCCGTGRID